MNLTKEYEKFWDQHRKKMIEEIEEFICGLQDSSVKYDSSRLWMKKDQIVYLYFDVENMDIFLNSSLLGGFPNIPSAIHNYLKEKFNFQKIHSRMHYRWF